MCKELGSTAATGIETRPVRCYDLPSTHHAEKILSVLLKCVRTCCVLAKMFRWWCNRQSADAIMIQSIENVKGRPIKP